MTYIAHRTDDGREQSVEKHLEGTAKLAEGFALEVFKPYAELLGRMHDIGKYAKDFQRRIKGHNIRFEHAVCGAIELDKA